MTFDSDLRTRAIRLIFTPDHIEIITTFLPILYFCISFKRNIITYNILDCKGEI